MCQNGGLCSLTGDNYKCSCVNDYFGRNCQHKTLSSTIFKNSTILSEENSSNLINLIGVNKTNVKLLYQASRDGFDNEAFHAKCDAVSATLIVIKSKNSNIFGGFTSADWSGSGLYKTDSTAFLFSLVNSYNESVKMEIYEEGKAIYSYSGFSFVFGGSKDLYCSNDQCYSYLGNSYQLPDFLTYGTNEAYSFLGGSRYFQAVEIEVYWIDRNKLFC